MNFIDKRVSNKRAIAMLQKNGVQINEEEAEFILDFLYLVAKGHNKPKETQNTKSLKRNRTSKKVL